MSSSIASPQNPQIDFDPKPVAVEVEPGEPPVGNDRLGRRCSIDLNCVAAKLTDDLQHEPAAIVGEGHDVPDPALMGGLQCDKRIDVEDASSDLVVDLLMAALTREDHIVGAIAPLTGLRAFASRRTRRVLLSHDVREFAE